MIHYVIVLSVARRRPCFIVYFCNCLLMIGCLPCVATEDGNSHVTLLIMTIQPGLGFKLSLFIFRKVRL